MISLTVLTVAISVIIDVRLERRTPEIYEATSDIAKDALGNIRGVFASTAEGIIYAQYDQLLGKVNELGCKKAPAAYSTDKHSTGYGWQRSSFPASSAVRIFLPFCLSRN